MASLDLQHVSLGYQTQTVVQDLHLHLDSGEIGCLLGHSGCGKTTVLRAIAGFERLRAGRILIDDDEVAGPQQHRQPETRDVGMVFQDYALFPHLTVADNITFGLGRQAASARAARLQTLLSLVGLQGVAQRYPHQLSGGQQQRVALARALAPQPRLILLDEPFSNLDLDLRERLAIEVRDILKSQGSTALLVTHDQHEAFAVADKVGVMQAGRLCQWATPYTLYHEPANPFVANFVGEGVLLPGIGEAGGMITTELGSVHSQTPHTLHERLDVLLRPDDVQHDDDSRLRAVVQAKAFRGAQFLYTLALPSGQRILSLVPSHHDHAVGEAIGIRLEIDHVMTYRRDLGACRT